MKTSLSGSAIQIILKQGRRYARDGIVVVVGVKRAPDTLFAVIVSKKAVRRAVERNTIKRRIREAVRQISPPPFPFVILYQRGDTTYRHFQTTLHTIFKEIE